MAGPVDPPTDPHGFPPLAGRPAITSPRTPAPEPAEAAALACAFAVDYLSWDEDDPDRRGRVLLDHLPAAASAATGFGWSGRGRQRAEFALAGRIRPDRDGRRVLVDVRVRVTPYRAVGERRSPAQDDEEPAAIGFPAAAPAPTGRGWRAMPSRWIRVDVPVVLDAGRLRVEAPENVLEPRSGPPGEVPPIGPAPPPVEVLVEPSPRSAW